MELKVNINGNEIVLNVIKKIMKEAEFAKEVTEDYKKGFYDFGNAVINVFENGAKDDD